jgi:hypothetical protein
MTLSQGGRPQPAEFEQTIRARIAQRTGRRVRALEVEVTADRVVVCGRRESYYLKQLALQGVLDVVGPEGAGGVECNIQVATGPPIPPEGVG